MGAVPVVPSEQREVKRALDPTPTFADAHAPHPAGSGYTSGC